MVRSTATERSVLPIRLSRIAAERFWFGTSGGRAALDRQTGAVTSVSNVPGISMHEDSKGNVWFGGPGGLIRKDSVRELPNDRLAPGTQINYIHEDADGLLWLAAETGLLRFDPKTETYTNYTTQDGLPDNVVQCVLGDKSGNLWLSTNNGISRFNPRDNSFVNYHESDGLQGEQFNRKACSVDARASCIWRSAGFQHVRSQPHSSQTSGCGTYRADRVPDSRKKLPVQAGSVLPKPIWELDSLICRTKTKSSPSSLPP